MSRKTLKIEKQIFDPATGTFPPPAENPLDYEVATNRGRLIDYNCYERIVSDWAANPSAVNVAHFFSKQILLLLLSFEEAAGIAFCKCKRPGGNEESIAMYAAKDDGYPIGWSGGSETDSRKFIGGEWAMSITHQEFKTFLYQDTISGETKVNLKKFFDAISDMIKKEKKGKPENEQSFSEQSQKSFDTDEVK